MRRVFLLIAVVAPLAGCGWFGGHKNDEQAAAPPPGPPLSSDEVLKKDCSSDKWKQENLGLWYSVCRQPMKW